MIKETVLRTVRPMMTVTVPEDTLVNSIKKVVRDSNMDWETISDDPLGAQVEAVFVDATDTLGDNSELLVGQIDGDTGMRVDLMVERNNGEVEPFDVFNDYLK